VGNSKCVGLSWCRCWGRSWCGCWLQGIAKEHHVVLPHCVALGGREAPRLSDDVQVGPVGGRAVGLVVQRPAEERRRQRCARRGVDLEDYGVSSAGARALGVPDREEPGADPNDAGQDIRVRPAGSLAPQKISAFIVLLYEIVLAVSNAGSGRVSDAVKRIPDRRE
jgi:hypothetical protein